jgi:very-short-patch-repair endonuclease
METAPIRCRGGLMASALEDLFAFQLRAAQLGRGLEREHKFHPTRRWRFDFAWPADKVAVEVEGGHWTGGRHVRGSGFEADCEKYMEAMVLGWRVLRVTGGLVKSGRALAALETIFSMTATGAPGHADSCPAGTPSPYQDRNAQGEARQENEHGR